MNKISSLYYDFLQKVIRLPHGIKKLILVIIDLISLFLVVVFSNLLLYKFSFFEIKDTISDTLTFSIICLPIYFLTGQYKEITKFSSNNHLFYCFLRNIITVLIIILSKNSNFIYLFSIAISQAYLSFISRIFLSNLIGLSQVSHQKKIVIYGAGLAGAKLVNSLILNRENNILFFVDDNPKLWSRSILGIPIRNPVILERNEKQIDKLYLAIPTLKQDRKKHILNKIYNLSFEVLVVPSLEEIISGEAKISETRSVRLEDLIYRDIAKLNKSSIKKAYAKKTILITGGGGSIGREIIKQLILIKPEKIIILDFSEYNLYSLKNYLSSLSIKSSQIIFVLGNCCDKKTIDNLFKKFSIEILIHSAAYKHVPLVEENPLIGLANNILSTKILSDAAIKYKIEKAVLISTDKAVRPTNVMGASKRVAELVFLQSQKFASNKKEEYNTKFSIVRFGNVLGSSGSVIPHFINQIKNGGPVTITHPEITRYFMTIKEATILVLEAASMSKGGELFLLDMGEPVKIIDLARKLIKLKGLTVKDNININGDIEIKYIGLRDGEKLFEELLIDGEAKKTQNKYIFLGKESSIKFEESKSILLDKLITSIQGQNAKKSLILLKNIVPEWDQNAKFKN